MIKRTRFLWGTVISVVFLSIFFLFAFVALRGSGTKQDAEHEPINMNHVAKIRSTMERCRDQDVCVGGFLKWKDNFRILRISQCDRNCDWFETGITKLFDHFINFHASDKEFNKIAYVVLPNDSGWDAMAIAYAKQFVVKPRKK